MPAILTHYVAALDFDLGSKRLSDAFRLGSQGPDPFFFYGMFSSKKKAPSKKENRKFGVDLHNKDISAPYLAMIEAARNSEDKELAFAFIKGLFFHYAMDRFCHPFVFSRAGHDYSDKKRNKYFSSCHTKVESAIDMILSEEKGCYNEDPSFVLEIDDSDLKKISELFYYAFPNDSFLTPDSYRNGVINYAKVMRFINKPHYLKRGFLRIAVGKNSTPYALNYPRNLAKTYPNVDFLNLSKEKWLNPEDGRERSETFLELMEQAKGFYKDLEPLLEKAFGGEPVGNELHSLTADIDHNGKLYTNKMKYMSPIFPPKKDF